MFSHIRSCDFVVFFILTASYVVCCVLFGNNIDIDPNSGFQHFASYRPYGRYLIITLKRSLVAPLCRDDIKMYFLSQQLYYCILFGNNIDIDPNSEFQRFVSYRPHGRYLIIALKRFLIAPLCRDDINMYFLSQQLYYCLFLCSS